MHSITSTSIETQAIDYWCWIVNWFLCSTWPEKGITLGIFSLPRSGHSMFVLLKPKPSLSRIISHQSFWNQHWAQTIDVNISVERITSKNDQNVPHHVIRLKYAHSRMCHATTNLNLWTWFLLTHVHGQRKLRPVLWSLTMSWSNMWARYPPVAKWRNIYANWSRWSRNQTKRPKWHERVR